jgi:hypothetical protein
MLVGVVDSLEGCVVVLAGVVLAALGTFIGKTSHRRHLYWSTALVAIGVTAMIVFSKLGGIGGHSENSLWWGVLFVPYPIGWLLGLIGAVFTLKEFYRLRALPKIGLQ